MSPPSYRYKLTLAYKGTRYKGWQVQPNGLSIQEVVEASLARILQSATYLTAAGRTDSGVHALGQVAHLEVAKKIAPEKLQKSLNALLPMDIRVLSLVEVDSSFHARFSAKEKVYCYKICQNKVAHPFHRDYALHYPYPLSLSSIEKALPLFLGTKNFKAFTNQASNPEKNYVKTLRAITLEEEEGYLSFTFYGNGFLYKMVRNLTATLLALGRGQLLDDDLPALFASEDRKKCPAVLPPHGLTLIKVLYNSSEQYTT